MDARVATPKPKNITLAQAATVGVGFYVMSHEILLEKLADIQQTACLGVLKGLNIPLPDAANLPAPTGEWAVRTTHTLFDDPILIRPS
jgi:hypothetical protein